MFVRFTRYNPKFASLSKYNPGHTNSSIWGFLTIFYAFRDFDLLFFSKQCEQTFLPLLLSPPPPLTCGAHFSGLLQPPVISVATGRGAGLPGRALAPPRHAMAAVPPGRGRAPPRPHGARLEGLRRPHGAYQERRRRSHAAVAGRGAAVLLPRLQSPRRHPPASAGSTSHGVGPCAPELGHGCRELGHGRRRAQPRGPRARPRAPVSSAKGAAGTRIDDPTSSTLLCLEVEEEPKSGPHTSVVEGGIAAGVKMSIHIVWRSKRKSKSGNL
jgi:hypothetical protein